jgi:hypothetical protein
MIFLSLLAPVCALRARGVSLVATREEIADPQPPTLVVPPTAQGAPVALGTPNDTLQQPQVPVAPELQPPVAQQPPQIPSLPEQGAAESFMTPQGVAPPGAAQHGDRQEAVAVPVAPMPTDLQMPQPSASTQTVPIASQLPPQQQPPLQSLRPQQQQQHRQQETFMDVFKAARAKQIPTDAATDPGRREAQANSAVGAVAASQAAAVHWKIAARDATSGVRGYLYRVRDGLTIAFDSFVDTAKWPWWILPVLLAIGCLAGLLVCAIAIRIAYLRPKQQLDDRLRDREEIHRQAFLFQERLPNFQRGPPPK